jgi:hypothetical protein
VKVWILWGDNGEEYDDHIEWIESVHASEAGATAAKGAAEAKLNDRPPRSRDKTTYSVTEQEVLP